MLNFKILSLTILKIMNQDTKNIYLSYNNSKNWVKKPKNFNFHYELKNFFKKYK